MTVTINVTEKHIKAGETCAAGHCPIALAARDLGTMFTNPLVGLTTMSFGSSFSREFSTLPKEAQDFVCNFDDNLPVKPFSFEIEVPE